VKKKTVRKMLKKMGLKLRGGADAAAGPVEVTADKLTDAKDATGVAAAGGRRRRRTGKKSRRSRKVFGLF
jgi:hypothetical protein